MSNDRFVIEVNIANCSNQYEILTPRYWNWKEVEYSCRVSETLCRPSESFLPEEKRVREKKEKDLIHLKNEKNHGEL